MLPSGGGNLSNNLVNEISQSAILAPDSSEAQPSLEPEQDEGVDESITGHRSSLVAENGNVVVPGNIPDSGQGLGWERKLGRYLNQVVREQNGMVLEANGARRKGFMHFVDQQQRMDDNTNYKLEVERLKSELLGTRFNTASSLELIEASDATFDDVMRDLGPHVNMEVLDSLFAPISARKETGTLTTTNNSKFETLAEYLIQPKLKDENVTLRAMYPYYEKVVQVDPVIAIDKILLPLIQDDVPIHKSLFVGIDLENLTWKVLRWIVDSKIELSEHLIHILNTTTQSKLPTPDSVELLLTVLHRNFEEFPYRDGNGSFFYGFLRRFENLLQIGQLHRAFQINRSNESMLLQPTERLLNAQLAKRELERQGRARYSGQL